MVDTIGKPDNFINPNKDSILSAVKEYSAHTSIRTIDRLNVDKDDFEFSEVSIKEVQNRLKKIDVRKAIGCDNISPYFLKLAANELAFPLTKVINTCISQNVFPHVFKRNEISPVFKAKDHFVKSNYRPVGCSVAVSKVIEQVMARQVKNFFESIFHDKLSAYRQDTGCENVVVNLIEEWKRGISSFFL